MSVTESLSASRLKGATRGHNDVQRARRQSGLAYLWINLIIRHLCAMSPTCCALFPRRPRLFVLGCHLGCCERCSLPFRVASIAKSVHLPICLLPRENRAFHHKEGPRMPRRIKLRAELFTTVSGEDEGTVYMTYL